jgi:hypothetical protein
MNSESKRSLQQSGGRIQRLWRRLGSVAAFTCASEPGPASKTDWHGHGWGSVELIERSDAELHFLEHGSFEFGGSEPVEMYNTFIWQRRDNGLRLSHGRHGEPVFLFDLEPAGAGVWKSARAYECADDLYLGILTETAAGLDLEWTITGPRKDEHLCYRYAADGRTGQRKS